MIGMEACSCGMALCMHLGIARRLALLGLLVLLGLRGEVIVGISVCLCQRHLCHHPWSCWPTQKADACLLVESGAAQVGIAKNLGSLDAQVLDDGNHTLLWIVVVGKAEPERRHADEESFECIFACHLGGNPVPLFQNFSQRGLHEMEGRCQWGVCGQEHLYGGHKAVACT